MLIEALEDRRLLEGTPLVAAQENLEDPTQLLSQEKSSSEAEDVFEELASGDEGGAGQVGSQEETQQEGAADEESESEEASDSEANDQGKVDSDSEQSQPSDDDNEEGKPAVTGDDQDDGNQEDDAQDGDQAGGTDDESDVSSKTDIVSQVESDKEEADTKLVSAEKDDADDEQLEREEPSLSSQGEETERPAAESDKSADDEEPSLSTERKVTGDAEVDDDSDTYFVSTTNSDDDDLPAFSSAEPLGSSRSDDLVAFDTAKPVESSEPQRLQAQLDGNNEKIVSARDIQEDSKSRLDKTEEESEGRYVAAEALDKGDESLARAEKEQNKAQKQYSKLEKGNGNSKSIEKRSKSVQKFTDRASNSIEKATRDVESGRQLVDGVTGDFSLEQTDGGVSLSVKGRVELPKLPGSDSGSEAGEQIPNRSAIGVNANAEVFREPKADAPFGLSISGSDSDGSETNDTVSLSLSTPFFNADAALTLEIASESTDSALESVDSTDDGNTTDSVAVSRDSDDASSRNSTLVSGNSTVQEDAPIEQVPVSVERTVSVERPVYL